MKRKLNYQGGTEYGDIRIYGSYIRLHHDNEGV